MHSYFVLQCILEIFMNVTFLIVYDCYVLWMNVFVSILLAHKRVLLNSFPWLREMSSRSAVKTSSLDSLDPGRWKRPCAVTSVVLSPGKNERARSVNRRPPWQAVTCGFSRFAHAYLAILADSFDPPYLSLESFHTSVPPSPRVDKCNVDGAAFDGVPDDFLAPTSLTLHLISADWVNIPKNSPSRCFPKLPDRTVFHGLIELETDRVQCFGETLNNFGYSYYMYKILISLRICNCI